MVGSRNKSKPAYRLYDSVSTHHSGPRDRIRDGNGWVPSKPAPSLYPNYLGFDLLARSSSGCLPWTRCDSSVRIAFLGPDHLGPGHLF
nr:hypothetical protein Itr_chr09CG10280 [Ipomoea trifida]